MPMPARRASCGRGEAGPARRRRGPRRGPAGPRRRGSSSAWTCRRRSRRRRRGRCRARRRDPCPRGPGSRRTTLTGRRPRRRASRSPGSATAAPSIDATSAVLAARSLLRTRSRWARRASAQFAMTPSTRAGSTRAPSAGSAAMLLELRERERRQAERLLHAVHGHDLRAGVDEATGREVRRRWRRDRVGQHLDRQVALHEGRLAEADVGVAGLDLRPGSRRSGRSRRT